MARRNTIKDVAREAGVSVATVNRVIAGHSNVRPETAARVAEAAQNVNYHGANLIKLNMPANLPTVRKSGSPWCPAVALAPPGRSASHTPRAWKNC